MASLTIYVPDDAPGGTVEEKSYGVMAEGFEEAGHDANSFPSHLDMVKRLYRITGAVLTDHGEWMVTVEGDADDIGEYEDILEMLK